MKTVKMKLGTGYVDVSVPEENFLGMLVKEVPPSTMTEDDVVLDALAHPIGTPRLKENRQARQHGLHRHFRCNARLAADERLPASYRERAERRRGRGQGHPIPERPGISPQAYAGRAREIARS